MFERVLGVALVCLKLAYGELINGILGRPGCLGESTSPFIDEGDGLTSERERESTYATKSCCPRRWVQDDGRRLLHCLCQTHVGGFTAFTMYGKLTSPTTLSMPRGMWGVLPCSPGMGIDGAHNTVGQTSVPTTLLGF